MAARVAVSAVVPAAGRSSRMGRPKLLLPWGESTVVGSLVAALLDGGVEHLCLVTAPGDEALARWGEERSLGVAVNPTPQRGMLSSIQTGVAALAPVEGPLLVTPADLPELSAATVRRLLEALTAAGSPLAVPLHRGRRGHPLAVAPARVPEIAALDPAVGLRQLLERHAAEVLEVPVDDPGCLRDIDTPEDYRRLTGLGAPDRMA
jgi:molybdenum cofactor cytidylyltransferase